MTSPVPLLRHALRALALVVLSGAAFHAGAQHTLNILVQDSATAEPLPGASAVLVGTPRAATADADGRMTFRDLADGPQVFRFALVGYRGREVTVTLPRSTPDLVVRLASANEELEEAVVTATRTGSRIDDVPQKIEVLGADELLEEGSLEPGNVMGLLGDISSVQVQQLSAVSGASQVRMQGLQGRHTLLLRDGLPAYGGLSGGFDILRLPPLDLARIEVLKGPSSTFHGGGAIAGAIDFVTKEPTDSLTGLVMVNATTLREGNMNAYLSGPLGKAAFTLFAGATGQQAMDVDGDGWTDVPALRQVQVHPQLFLKPSARSTLRVGLLAQDERRRGGRLSALDALDDTAAFVEHREGRRLALDLIGEHRVDAGHALTVKGSVGRYWQQARSTLAPAAPRSMQDNLYGEAYWKAADARRTWVVGANFWGMRLSGPDSATQSLGTVGAFAQYALHRERWPNIELGLRTDHNARYGTFVLPSIAALYKAGARLVLRANAGTGYQLPDRSQPYGLVAEEDPTPVLGTGVGAERSFGGTAEWTWRAVVSEQYAVFIDQTFFLTRISDPLAVVPVNGDASLVNAPGHTLTRGIDNYIRITHGDAELYLGYTWTVPQQVAGRERTLVAYTPEHRAAATLSRVFGPHWRAGIEASYSGRQDRFDGTRTGDQWATAAMVGYTTGPWNIVLNGENLLDVRQTREERVVLGTLSRPVFVPLWAPIDGRAINLSVLYRFG